MKIGQHVQCARFRGIGEIVDGPNNRGEFRVTTGPLTFWIAGTELRPASPEPEPKSKRKSKRSKAATEPSDGGRTTRLDLHGKTVAEAQALLETTLDRALLAGTSRLEIVHGLGSGRVRDAVHAMLSRSRHIAHYKLDDHNPGVTWVFLD